MIMKPEEFRNAAGTANAEFVSRITGIPCTKNGGIDLYDPDLGIGVEVKSRYVKYTNKFAVALYQADDFRKDNPSAELYWAFVLYDLKKEPSRIDDNADDYIFGRKVFFTDWDFVRRFPVSDVKTGPFIYVPASTFASIGSTQIIKSHAKVSIPKDTSLERLIIERKKTKIKTPF